METMENFMSNEHAISTMLKKGKNLLCQVLSKLMIGEIFHFTCMVFYPSSSDQ